MMNFVARATSPWANAPMTQTRALLETPDDDADNSDSALAAEPVPTTGW